MSTPWAASSLQRWDAYPRSASRSTSVLTASSSSRSRGGGFGGWSLKRPLRSPRPGRNPSDGDSSPPGGDGHHRGSGLRALAPLGEPDSAHRGGDAPASRG